MGKKKLLGIQIWWKKLRGVKSFRNGFFPLPRLYLLFFFYLFALHFFSWVFFQFHRVKENIFLPIQRDRSRFHAYQGERGRQNLDWVEILTACPSFKQLLVSKDMHCRSHSLILSKFSEQADADTGSSWRGIGGMEGLG